MTWRSDSNQLITGKWLSTAYAGHGITGAAMRAGTGTGGSGAGLLYNDWDSGDDAKEFRGLIVTPPSSGTFTLNEDGSFSLVGAADGTYSVVYRLFVDGADLGTATASVTVGAGTAVNANASFTLNSLTFNATVGVQVSAQSSVTLSTFGFAATAASVVAAQSAVTLSGFNFTATAAALYGARSSVQFDAFSFSSTASVTGEGVESFPTPAGRTLIVAAIPRIYLAPIQDRRHVVAAD